MELKPIDVSLTEAEKYELVKRVLKEKIEELQNVERRMKELMREDAETAYLESFIGAEYINPEGKTNQAELEPLQAQREYLAYVITRLEERKAELEQRIAGRRAAAEQVRPAPRPPSPSSRDMWGSSSS